MRRYGKISTSLVKLDAYIHREDQMDGRCDGRSGVLAYWPGYGSVPASDFYEAVVFICGVLSLWRGDVPDTVLSGTSLAATCALLVRTIAAYVTMDHRSFGREN
jgi:hypothetical protein